MVFVSLTDPREVLWGNAECVRAVTGAVANGVIHALCVSTSACVQAAAAIEEHHRVCLPCCPTELSHPRAIKGGQVELRKWEWSKEGGECGEPHTVVGHPSSLLELTCTVFSTVQPDTRVRCSGSVPYKLDGFVLSDVQQIVVKNSEFLYLSVHT